MNCGHARAHKAKILYSWGNQSRGFSFICYSTMIMLRAHRTEASSPRHSSGPEHCVVKQTLNN